MQEPIISVSGLRGIIGESLSPDVAMRFAAAYVGGLQPGPIVVTRDGRATGAMIADAARSAIQATGFSVIDAGIAATPTTGVLVRSLGARGGIQISASHNPSQYNGLKLFDSDGRVITADAGAEVIDRYYNSQPAWVQHQQVGDVENYEDATSEHLSLVLSTIDTERIREKQFRVLLDSNHGAGSLLGRQLLNELNCTLTCLGAEPNGQFEHPPEPTAENLSNVRQRVTYVGGDVGFCQDPDADRLAVIDETGRYIGEEYTLALCLDHVLSQRSGAVVTNCATSQMSEDIAKKYNVPFFRSAVGEANVVQMMLENEAAFGGEGNGGPIDPRVGFVRDSFVGMALILDALASSGKLVSQLADELPSYQIHKTKVDLSRERLPAALDAIESRFPDSTADRMDGLRLDWEQQWLLVRGSNTEPIVRLIAEAPTQDDAIRLCQQAKTVIDDLPHA